MSVRFTIPTTDFSAFGNPKVINQIDVFPADNLAALYYFDQGTAGEAWAGPAVDKTENLNHAPLVAGSNAVKTSGGVSNVVNAAAAANNGFGLLTPVDITSQFTVFGISRNLYAVATGVQTYLIPWMSSANCVDPTAPNLATPLYGNANSAEIGKLHLNQQNNGTSGNYPELGVFNTDTAGAGWGAGGIRPALSISAGGLSKSSWIAWALSFDADVGVKCRMLGGGVEINEAADASVWADGQASLDGKHMFGGMNFGRDSDGVKGSLAMAGIYTGVAKTAAESDAIIAAMKDKFSPALGAIY